MLLRMAMLNDEVAFDYFHQSMFLSMNEPSRSIRGGQSDQVVAAKIGTMPSSSPRSESAKEFLISKVLRQAEEDGVLLSDIEKRMLRFSEGTASADDIEAAEQF